jgi:hypothetical protein
MSFPTFSGLFASFIAAAAAAPDEIPTCKKHAPTFKIEIEYYKALQQKNSCNYLITKIGV